MPATSLSPAELAASLALIDARLTKTPCAKPVVGSVEHYLEAAADFSRRARAVFDGVRARRAAARYRAKMGVQGVGSLLGPLKADHTHFALAKMYRERARECRAKARAAQAAQVAA